MRQCLRELHPLMKSYSGRDECWRAAVTNCSGLCRQMNRVVIGTSPQRNTGPMGTGNIGDIRDIGWMKNILAIAGVSIALIGCAREDNAGYNTGAAPVTEQGTAQTNNASEISDAGVSTRLNSIARTNAGPETGVGAATAASSGVGTATASGSAAVESDAAIDKRTDQNQEPNGSRPK